MSAASAVIIDPSRFYVPYKPDVDSALKPIFYWYWMSLAACLVKEFYDERKVVLTGIRRISLSLVDGDIDDGSAIKALEMAVEWVYLERAETRLILLMDRISLDLVEGGPLLPSLFACVAPALEQAKYRYEFVIKDRKEAHAKELADLQKDVRAATDHYSRLTNDLVSGLLRDAISSVFILSIILFSRLVGTTSIQTDGIKFLFWGLACYLALSLTVRLVYSCQSLKMTKDDLVHWRDAVRNHMSREELEGHVNGRCRRYEKMYLQASLTVTFIYIALISIVVFMPKFLMSNDHDSIENDGKVELVQDGDISEAADSEGIEYSTEKQEEQLRAPAAGSSSGQNHVHEDGQDSQQI